MRRTVILKPFAVSKRDRHFVFETFHEFLLLIFVIFSYQKIELGVILLTTFLIREIHEKMIRRILFSCRRIVILPIILIHRTSREENIDKLFELGNVPQWERVNV